MLMITRYPTHITTLTYTPTIGNSTDWILYIGLNKTTDRHKLHVHVLATLCDIGLI